MPQDLTGMRNMLQAISERQKVVLQSLPQHHYFHDTINEKVGQYQVSQELGYGQY